MTIEISQGDKGSVGKSLLLCPRINNKKKGEIPNPPASQDSIKQSRTEATIDPKPVGHQF